MFADVLALAILFASAAESQRCHIQVPLGMQDRLYGIPDENMKASSYYSDSTAPWYGRLNYNLGAGAWMAGVQDNKQYLEIKFSRRKVITGIATQGRRGSKEFVIEYYLDFSDDTEGLNWLRYRDEFGQPFEFLGNSDDKSVSRTFLKYPLVARYVRFIPNRWNKLISMRVELYGCDYETWGFTFDGKTRLEYAMDLSSQQFESFQDRIEFRFRTKQSNGIFFYASDTQGDYLSIEIWRSQLRVNLNLGESALPQLSDNSFFAGSLLDDGKWHDVRVIRSGRLINVSVDRLEVWQDVIGEFYHFDINRNLMIGGVDTFTNKRGVSVSRNFSGCIENFYFNELNILRDITALRFVTKPIMNVTTQPITIGDRYLAFGSLKFDCGLVNTAADIPITLRTRDAVIRLTGIEQSPIFRISFIFRTFQPGGTLVYHQLATNRNAFVWIALTEEGYLRYRVDTKKTDPPENALDDVLNNDYELFNNAWYFMKIQQWQPQPGTRVTKSFADGLWHQLSLRVEKDKANLTIDGYSRVTIMKMTISTSSTLLIGDGAPGFPGYIGCIKSLEVAGKFIDPTAVIPHADPLRTIVGRCNIRDRCLPTPCENDGICTQDWDSFYCDCRGTGYTGAVCHTPLYVGSCPELKQYTHRIDKEHAIIDLDGSGMLKPFRVTCDFTDRGEMTTIIHHDAEEWQTVENFISAGSYSKTIDYEASIGNINALVHRSHSCRQRIVYKCHNARLFANPEEEHRICDSKLPNCTAKTYGWWVGRNGLPMHYWGGASPETGKCQCGTINNCAGVPKGAIHTCNCDAPWTSTQTEKWLVDEGYLIFKEDLPVTEVHFGDTSATNLLDPKKSMYQLGPLECVGDVLLENVVTFRRRDSNIEFPPFWTGFSFDIKFQFKTTARSGVFFQDVGPIDFLEAKLVEGNKIQFRFSAERGIQVLEKDAGMFLNDNLWHTVHIERNRKQAWLKVDNQGATVLDEPMELQFRTFYFTQNFSIGSSVKFDQGFVGCLKAFQVNGVLYDLAGKIRSGEYTYGVAVGCHQKCAPVNPCLNDGECEERYDSYYCECGRTAFRGHICGREVGVNLQPSMMIKYRFPADGQNTGSLDEYIRVGFSTQMKQGILMQIINPDIEEFITVYVNNNGGVTVEFNFGWGRDEVSTAIPDVDLCNGQQHVVIVSRHSNGRVVRIRVDDYPVAEKEFSRLLRSTSDTRLDQPKFLYMGKNESTAVGRGFQGCIHMAQFNNIFPLKLAFQDPPSPLIELLPRNEQFREDKCGFEEVLPENVTLEMRPLPTPPSNITFESDPFAEEPLLSSDYIVLIVVTGLSVTFIAVFLYCCRTYRLEFGEYDTGEDCGQEFTDQVDAAIKYGDTGQPEVGFSNECFI